MGVDNNGGPSGERGGGNDAKGGELLPEGDGKADGGRGNQGDSSEGKGPDVEIGQAERGNGGVLPEGDGEAEARDRAEAEEERQRREAEESGARAEEKEKPKYDEHGNLIEQNTDPHPIGKGMFGNIYDQFRGRLKEAFDFLIKRKSGDLLGVFHRDGFGDIDLVWGDKRGGAEHIIDKHVGEGKSFATEEEAFTEIDRIIKTGKKDFENGDKVVFKDGNKIVTVRKNWRENGKKIADKNWVLSAYDKTSADSESPVATNKSLAGSATSVSDGKVNTLSSEKQGADAKNGDGDVNVASKQSTKTRPSNRQPLGSVDELADAYVNAKREYNRSFSDYLKGEIDENEWRRKDDELTKKTISARKELEDALFSLSDDELKTVGATKNIEDVVDPILKDRARFLLVRLLCVILLLGCCVEPVWRLLRMMLKGSVKI